MERNKVKITFEEASLEGISYSDFHRRWLILITLCGSLLVVMLSNSALNLALPSIAVDTNASSTDLTWIVESYSLLFAALLFTAGAVGDRYGRKLLMQFGLIIFLVSSLYAAFLAANAFELILMRGLMGVGGAMVMPTTLSILNVAFPRKERITAVAIWSAVAGAGVLVGSIVSGFLLEHFEWESVFILCAGVAGVVLITNQLLTRESKDNKEEQVDWLGGILSSVGLGSLVFGLMESSHNDGWSQPLVWVSLAVSVIFLLAFVLWQLKTSHPMLDVRLFKSKRFSVATIAITLAFFAINGIMFIMSQLFQLVLGYTPMQAALMMLPIIAPMGLFVPLVPKVLRHVGEKWTLFIGSLFLTVGFGYATFWPNEPDYWQVWFAIVMILGGMTFMSTPATNMILDSVPKNRSGMASAMNDTTRELGGALGVAVLGSIMISEYNQLVAGKLAVTAGLPDRVSGLQDSLASALQTIQLLHLDEALTPSFKQMWMEGLSTAMGVATAVSLLTSIFVLSYMRKKRETDDNSL